MQVLASDGILQDALTLLPHNERYTYIFNGNAQALDHIFLSPSLQGSAVIDVVHINTGFPEQTSDHDPIVALVRR